MFVIQRGNRNHVISSMLAVFPYRCTSSSSVLNQFKLANVCTTVAKVLTALGKGSEPLKRGVYCILFISFYVRRANFKDSETSKRSTAHKRQNVTSWRSGVKVHVTKARGRTWEYRTKPRGTNGLLFAVDKMSFRDQEQIERNLCSVISALTFN
jgi:hypothetical protein